MIRRSVIVYKINTDILLNNESLTQLVNKYQLQILDIQKRNPIISLTETHQRIEEITKLLNSKNQEHFQELRQYLYT